MMKRTIEYTAQFRRDYKRARKRGLNLELMKSAVAILADDVPLPERMRDHPLTGQYRGYRECHIQPDWLLVYRKADDRLLLVLHRTGTHSDLFDE